MKKRYDNNSIGNDSIAIIALFLLVFGLLLFARSVSGTGSVQSTLSKLVIWDETDPKGGGLIRYQGQDVKFWANFTNVTSGISINGTNVWCNVTFNISGGWTPAVNMTFNSTSLLYEYTRSFVEFGTFNWNATCNGIAQGYDILQANDTVTITADTVAPYGYKISPPSPANGTITSILSHTFSVNASDIALANLTLYIWNSTADLIHTNSTNLMGIFNETNFSYTLPYDDNYKWSVLIKDVANNQNWTDGNNWTITIDTTYPLVSYVAPTEANGTYFSRNWIAVNVSVIEKNLANITFVLYNTTGLVNSTIYSTQIFFINFTNLAEGSYVYNVTITDKVNKGNLTSSYNIILDRTPPSVSFSCSPVSVLPGETITCSCSASDLYLNSTDYTKNPSTANIGNFNTECSATDYAGNMKTATFSYQVVAPSGVISKVYDLGILTEENITLGIEDKINFVVEGKNYSAILKLITPEKIKLFIANFSVSLKINETAPFDLDFDGFNETIITLRDIKNFKANLFMKTISKPSLPKKVICGDNICEANENCENCWEDCACKAGEKCVKGACIMPIMPTEKKKFPYIPILIFIVFVLAIVALLKYKKLKYKKRK